MTKIHVDLPSRKERRLSKQRKSRFLRHSTNDNPLNGKHLRLYFPLKVKFTLSHFFAGIWLTISIYLSRTWVHGLAMYVTLPVAIIIIAGIAYIPGYINAFTVASLIFDTQPTFKVKNPRVPVTVLIACHNEANIVNFRRYKKVTQIGLTLEYLHNQTYLGEIKVIVIDNNASDDTSEVARRYGKNLYMDLRVIKEPNQGKHNALNTALQMVDTPYFITLDADTVLMPGSIQYLIARQLSSPPDVVATAGTILARNGRKNFWTRIQEWDYFLGIASIKRLQGMYQSVLVAQGAYSVYETEKIRRIGGFPDVIGEDIVVTWKLLENGWKIYFEPLAVAFTDVPESLKHFQRQRSRWARGMVEALRRIKPWQHKLMFARYATLLNLWMPFLDTVYTLVWMPGVILVFCGHEWVAGPITLLVLPLALLQNYTLYVYQSRVFQHLNLRMRKNQTGYVFYVLSYQAFMSPISLWGYVEELFNQKRVWK